MSPARRASRTSAGIALYRVRHGELEVFLVHPGGPFWARKDTGAWSIPKGEYLPDEEPLTAARREFEEETGFAVDGAFVGLEPVTQAGGKMVLAWAVEGDCDPAALRSSTFTTEWPPRSGQHAEFPEVDRASWFTIPLALEKINPGQRPLLVQLARIVSTR